MEYLWWTLGSVGVLLLLAFLLSLYCYMRVFYSPKRKPLADDEFDIPFGSEYQAISEQIKDWVREYRTLPHEELTLTSRDGLALYARYYEKEKGLPVEILCHGYRGCGERDMSAGISRAFALDRNAIVIDHRASGRSEGHTVTFGIKERHDVIDWAKLAAEKFDTGTPIIITGISMGAATVMSAASMDLPPNVVGILADCGYTSTREIVKKVMRDLHLPTDLLYPFARLSAILLGGFDPDASSPIDSMRACRLPVIFFHGDADDFVPCSMSEENFAACASLHKRLVITPGAGHGLCFPVDQQGYLAELDAFFAPYL